VPRTVDHDQRRSEVTSIAADLVAGGGRGALTVRGVAEAAGCSTTVVSHYFDDMSHLLHETYALSVRRSARRLDAVIAHDPSDIVGLVEAVLPLDAERTDDWRIWLAFWGDALASDAFAREQRQRARTATRRFRSCLDVLAAQGRLRVGLDIEIAADRISSLVPGIAAEAIFDPRRWTAARQRRVLHDELATLGVDAPTATRRAS
jgi:AcrR family transcriptional regulator